MPFDMLVHDKRLVGTAPAIANNIYDVDGSVPVGHILGWTNVVATGAGGLRRLIFMCHGYVGDTHRGGWGLQLGREGIDWGSVPLFVQLRGKVRVIVLYACKPLDIDAPHGYSGTMLWRRIANTANCFVVGSNSDQVYTYGKSPINFGDWEGRVMLVAPNGAIQDIDPKWSLPD